MATTRRVLLAALALALLVGAPAARAGEPIGIAETVPTHCGVDDVAIAKEGGAWFTCFEAADGGYSGRAKAGRVTAAGQVTEFDGPFPKGGGPEAMAVAADGSLWLALGSLPNTYGSQRISPQLAHVTPSGEVTVTDLMLGKEAHIGQLVAAPSGYLWFVTVGEYGGARDPQLWQISPAGQISPAPVALEPHHAPQIVVGTEGDLWLTNPNKGSKVPILRLTPAGEVTRFGVGLKNFRPTLPFAAPGGGIGYFGNDRRRTAVSVGLISPAGEVKRNLAAVSGLNSYGEPVVDGTGTIWYPSNYPRGGIGRITPGGRTTVSRKCLTYTQPGFGPAQLAVGHEGDIWFTAVETRELPSISDPPSIGVATPDGHAIQIFAGVEGEPRSIAAGPEGGAWFSTFGGLQRIKPISGIVNTFGVWGIHGKRPDGHDELTLSLPGPGKVEVKPIAFIPRSGEPIPLPGRTVTHTAKACGNAGVPIQPEGAALPVFKKRGEATEEFAITFTPDGGTPYAEEGQLTFHRRVH